MNKFKREVARREPCLFECSFCDSSTQGDACCFFALRLSSLFSSLEAEDSDMVENDDEYFLADQRLVCS